MRYSWAFIAIALTISSLLLPRESPDTITIFIHGSIGLRPYLAVSTMINLIQDTVHNSPYHAAVELMRKDRLYRMNQAIQDHGLVRIAYESEPIDTNLGAWLTADCYDMLRTDTGTHHYYTYGWSGLISGRERAEEGIRCYEALTKLHTTHPTARIIIIGYSHGGNIALNMANAHAENVDWCIDTLILLGTPIQRENDHCVCSPLFKKIYNVYSHEDHVQRLDCFSLNRFFSRRHFKSCSRYTVPGHLTQVEVRISITSPKRKHYDRSPGHTELWFFAWPEAKNHLYRKNFPLYPIPIVCTMPAIIDAITAQSIPAERIVFDWRIDESYALIRKRHHHTKQRVFCLSPEERQKIIDRALKRQPNGSYTAAYAAQPHLYTRITEQQFGTRNHTTHCSVCGS
jgi:pimeloyl-ACP methyl ester carboxylesterase